MNATVISVSRSSGHSFRKACEESINLIEGFGVEGDVHAGKKIKHTFLAKEDPDRKNIRQIHLIAAELFTELKGKGFNVDPGQLGENITTEGIDLLSLPTGTLLHIGNGAVIELTALRQPCIQIDEFQQGLLKEVVYKDSGGNIIRKVGVMGVILVSGAVSPNDEIIVETPDKPHHKLDYVW